MGPLKTMTDNADSCGAGSPHASSSRRMRRSRRMPDHELWLAEFRDSEENVMALMEENDDAALESRNHSLRNTSAGSNRVARRAGT